MTDELLAHADTFELRAIGRVESSLKDIADAPNQGEGAPDAWVVLDPAVREAATGLTAGDEVILITWLDRARRDVLSTYPGSNPNGPITGVFSLRSPARPNPLGLHRVTILDRDGLRVHVRPLEAVDGTPVVDIKPVLDRRER